MAEGMKYDDGKLQWHLLRRGVPDALEGAIKVLEFGAKKYRAFSWKEVADANVRYRNALDRHLAALDKGEEVDEDSGLPHIYHVVCNALFLGQLYYEDNQLVAPQEVGDLPNTWRTWVPELTTPEVQAIPERYPRVEVKLRSGVTLSMDPRNCWWESMPLEPENEIVAWRPEA